MNPKNKNLLQLHLWEMLIRSFSDDLLGQGVLLNYDFSSTQPLPLSYINDQLSVFLTLQKKLYFG